MAQRQVTLQASSGGPSYPNLLAGGTLVPGAVQYFANNFQLPRIQQLDAIFEREIARNTVVSASYLFAYGQYLPNFVDTNLPAPAGYVNVSPWLVGLSTGRSTERRYLLGATQPNAFTTARPNPAYAAITEIRSDVFSKYNALVLQFNRRMTGGLQVQGSYTLSRAYDNGQSSVTFTSNNLPFNAFDQTGENALSNFDRRHKFAFNLVYNTHYGNKDNGFALPPAEQLDDLPDLQLVLRGALHRSNHRHHCSSLVWFCYLYQRRRDRGLHDARRWSQRFRRFDSFCSWRRATSSSNPQFSTSI